tara:strand:+ start:1624 stop:2367 length:744 start_codon:yes stop_codon:yes gene_type:complete
MVNKGSKYINLLSKNIKSRKQGLRILKHYLLRLVCNNSSIANYQLDQLINNYFSCSPKGLNILDIGSGLCNYYPENVIESRNKYFACDLSDDLKEFLKKRGIKFIQGDMVKDNLALKENSFDIIICSHVIEHIEEPSNILFEINKLLKISGILFLKTPDIKVVKWNFFNDFTHIKPYTKNSLKEQVESDTIQVINCTSSTLYKDFSINLLKNNPFNPFNLIFLIIGFYTYYIRSDMREIICIARKSK